MLVRVYSQPIQVEETSLEFFSDIGKSTYDPFDNEDDSIFNSISNRHDNFSSASFHVPGQYPSTPPATSPSELSGLEQVATTNPSLGLPQDWIIFPLSNTGTTRKKSVRIRIDNGRPSISNNVGDTEAQTGCIDVDWSDPDKPIDFSAITDAVMAKIEKVNIPTPWAATDKQLPGPEPICFSIVEAQPNLDVDTLSQVSQDTQDTQDPPPYSVEQPTTAITTAAIPTPPTEAELHELRQKSRHLIRVVTRNSLGLATSITLSGVAPQLLIAAAINGFCLTRSAKHLHTHRHELAERDLHIRKRDIGAAVAEGVVVKLALMVITLNHDDILVFTSSFFAPAVDGVLRAHDAVDATLPVVDKLGEAFVAPVEALEHLLGLTTMAERALGQGVRAGWSASTRQLFQSIFVVGALQAGLEGAVELVQKHVGGATTRARKKAWGPCGIGGHACDGGACQWRPPGERGHGGELYKEERFSEGQQKEEYPEDYDKNGLTGSEHETNDHLTKVTGKSGPHTHEHHWEMQRQKEHDKREYHHGLHHKKQRHDPSLDATDQQQQEKRVESTKQHKNSDHEKEHHREADHKGQHHEWWSHEKEHHEENPNDKWPSHEGEHAQIHHRAWGHHAWAREKHSIEVEDVMPLGAGDLSGELFQKPMLKRRVTSGF